MTRVPEPRDLVGMAELLGFAMDEEESLVYQEGIDALLDSMQEIDEIGKTRAARLAPSRTVRDAGYVPTAEDNPFNCFIRRCYVRGNDRGPLRRRTVGLKDNICVAGVPMTLASHFMDGYVPDIDATAVARLLAAGADITGKLNMDDFSHTAHGYGTGVGNYGRVENPLKPENLTGGSSSGSAAAVAAGAVDLALGADQGGSIRIPASWCGVVGLKATFGLIPFTGVVGFDPSVDHVGPIARTVKDVALMLEAMAGPDGFDPRQVGIPARFRCVNQLESGVKGLRIGILVEGFAHEGQEPDVEEAIREAVGLLKKAGAVVSEVSIPEHISCGSLLPALVFIGSFYQMRMNSFGAAFSEGYHNAQLSEAFARFLDSRADLLPPRVKLTMLLGETLGAEAEKYYGAAKNATQAYRQAYDSAFKDVDCVVMPTVPIKAPLYVPPADRKEALRRTIVRKRAGVAMANAAAANITGHPALTVPCGSREGLPIGAMLVGPRLSDGLLLRVARSIEKALA